MAEFPDEIGKLKSAFCDALVTWQEQAERMITELNKTFPGVTSGLVVSKARFEAVMLAAEQSGLLSEKGSRIGGRVSPALVRQAKRQTGIETDTDLIEFALATVALEDNFAGAFKESRGTVDPTLKLGF